MVKRIDNFEGKPGPKTQQIKEHCLVLLEQQEQFEIPS